MFRLARFCLKTVFVCLAIGVGGALVLGSTESQDEQLKSALKELKASVIELETALENKSMSESEAFKKKLVEKSKSIELSAHALSQKASESAKESHHKVKEKLAQLLRGLGDLMKDAAEGLKDDE